MRLPVLLLTALLSLPTLAVHASEQPAKQQSQLSKDSLQNLMLAEFARHRGNYKEALEYYLKEANNHQDVYLAERITRLSMQLKQFPDMLDAAKHWQTLAPESDSANFFLALAYSFNQRPMQALQEMRKVLRNGEDTDFTRLASWLPSEDSYTKSYINELEQLYREYDDSYDLPMALAILYIRDKQNKPASKMLDEALINAEFHSAMVNYAVRFYLQLEQPEKALQAYKAALEQQPYNLQLRQRFATLATRHDLPEAERQFQLLLGQSPRNDYAIYHLALIHLERENIQDARFLLEQLIALQKRTDTAHYYLGLIDKHEGKLNNALQHFDAIEHPQQQQRVQDVTAQIYIEQDRLNDALQLLDNALADTDTKSNADPKQHARLQNLKVQVLEKQEKPDEAFAYLAELLEQNPNSIDLRFSRAMLAESNDRLQQAEDDLRHILELEPNSALALNALGYTLADRTDRYNEAFQLIQQAHKLEPEDPAVLDSMGWVLYRMGRYNEAVDYLKTAFTKFPDAEVAAHLGEVLWMLGHKEDATKVLKEALDASPDHNKLNETIKRLEVPLHSHP